MLSALLAVCHSARDALDIGQEAAVVEAGSQLWTFLNTNLVRETLAISPKSKSVLKEEGSTDLPVGESVCVSGALTKWK